MFNKISHCTWFRARFCFFHHMVNLWGFLHCLRSVPVYRVTPLCFWVVLIFGGPSLRSAVRLLNFTFGLMCARYTSGRQKTTNIDLIIQLLRTIDVLSIVTLIVTGNILLIKHGIWLKGFTYLKLFSSQLFRVRSGWCLFQRGS